MFAVEFWLDIGIWCYLMGFGHPTGPANTTHPAREPHLFWAGEQHGVTGFR